MKLDIEISRDGYKVLKLTDGKRDRFLGSKYNQKREIEKFLNQYSDFQEDDIYIVFGLSFGEHIIELVKKIHKKSKILIIEVNQELIYYWKSDYELKKIIKENDIFVASNNKEMKNFFEKHVNEFNVGNIKINFYCGYDNIYKQETEDIVSEIKNEIVKLTINRNTKLYFGEKWFDLLLDNLPYMFKGIPVNEFKNKYKNTPAIVVSAGPSLNKNIDELKSANNSLIFTGGRTLRGLVERDIKPDYLCVVDSGDISYRLVENFIDKVDCPLVFYEGTNSQVIKEHKGEKIFSASNRAISKIFNKDIFNLAAGGSVAHTMTLLAAYMGCNPIVFVGQDLAYTNDKKHAVCVEDSWENNFNKEYKKDDDIYVEDINGDLVRTSLVLNRFRISLENIIESFPNINFINATEGGARIIGTKNQTLKETLAQFRGKYERHKELNYKINYGEIKYNLKKIINYLEEYIILYKKRIMLRDETNKECNQTVIDEVNIQIEKIISKLYLIEPILFNIDYQIAMDEKMKVYSSDSNSDIIEKRNERDDMRYDNINSIVEKSLIKMKKIIEYIV